MERDEIRGRSLMPEFFGVRECEVADEPLLGGTSYDYADSFELLLDHPDERSAPEWMQVALRDASPAVMKLVALVHTRVAGFRPGPDGAGMPGWRATVMEHDVVML